MGLLEKRLCIFDNIHVLLQMRQKVWKLLNVSPNNLYKLHFWDNLYKLHPWLIKGTLQSPKYASCELFNIGHVFKGHLSIKDTCSVPWVSTVDMYNVILPIGAQLTIIIEKWELELS